MADGGAFGFFEADTGVPFAGLFALRFALGVEGLEVLMGDSVLDWEGERGTWGEEVGDDGPAIPDSDALRVGLEGVGVVVRERGVGCGIRLRVVFWVVRLVGVSLRSSEGEEIEPFGCGSTP